MKGFERMHEQMDQSWSNVLCNSEWKKTHSTQRLTDLLQHSQAVGVDSVPGQLCVEVTEAETKKGKMNEKREKKSVLFEKRKRRSK